MKNICILGAGGSSINIIKEIAINVNLERIIDNNNIRFGLISTSAEDIHKAQEYGLDILINKQIYNNKDIYIPVINRKITRQIEYLAIGEKICNGLSTFASIEIAEKAFYESEKNIDIFLKILLEDIDLVILISSFGGGNGTGLVPLLSNKIKNMNIKNSSIIGKPFEFEGEKRLHTYNQGIENLKKYTDKVIIIDSKTKEQSIKKAFKNRDIEFAKKAEEILYF